MKLPIDELAKGLAIRRAVWPAKDHAKMLLTEANAEKQLHIYRDTDNLYHPWMLFESDLQADDWVSFVPETAQAARPQQVIVGVGGSPRRIQ